MLPAFAAFAFFVVASTMSTAQTPGAPPPAAPPPLFATTKIADNVYVFRYGGYQSMFVVTPEGVIATDPIAYLRPQAAQTYIDEIRKITRAPIKYLVYSHHHYDHIAGGKPFKDAGASVIAHKNARAKLEALKYPDVVLPDMVVDQHSTIELGGTRVDLIYVGRNHSDNSLVMLLPKEKILFAVDFIPVQAVMFRDMPDGFLPDWFDSLDRVLALDFTTLIPGHPGPGGRMGTKDDVRAVKEYLTDLSNATRELANQGKCFDEAMKTLKLPKYESWTSYGTYLQGNIERFCEYWGWGI
ncbi:MAG: MBL fold metallo-hydrolase [Betaproteobacteria bacterium]|nr:MAG: MBL fold metallo-hydrolase [Betaproteobacteria bacterium]TMH66833.1 MAG: MBL fold metallo-hydrolase [Betaproteobacteria bacterium]